MYITASLYVVLLFIVLLRYIYIYVCMYCYNTMLRNVIQPTGHSLHEIFILREGRMKRIPDLVVWPS